jgi:uncharacterized protein (TIGR03083 family)
MTNFDGYVARSATQTELLRDALDGADPTLPVPTCPGWDLTALATHLGTVQRWAAGIVRDRTAEPAPFVELTPPADLAGWLYEGGQQLVQALRDAGPGTPVWTPVPSGVTDFYARRFSHEMAMHRADATFAVGRPYALDAAHAVDGVEEWLELNTLPRPELREYLGADRTVHLHATDVPDGEWVLDLTGEVGSWRRGHEKAAAAVKAPTVDLMLLLYRRRPVADLETYGDRSLLEFWPFG